MTTTDRRSFVKEAIVGFAAGFAPFPITQALALPGNNRTGSIMDVEHVVILMQENRAFDHYFGSLRGVRGFSDPRPLMLPNGASVWHQPQRDSAPVTPFHLNTKTSAAQALKSLDHSWKGSHARWKNHDAWIEAKTPLTMGYFTRDDLPFYYALADAFTICDAYHCSMFGPTNPNRMFLFTGTAGLAVGNDDMQAVENPPDETNETADPRNDSAAFKPYRWTSYAERLQEACIDWKVYQEFDNYGDNALAYFANFRGIDPTSPLYARGRAWAPTSHAGNAKESRGEHLVAQFRSDIAAGKLPQVSWIVAPTVLCEHPSACPANGEQLTARLLAALTENPEVWAKTVFILNYDENDGFFDHMLPPVPPTGAARGKSTVHTTGETYHGEPMGLGPRVPMIVVSPWSKGGFVNSELFDHTSVIRFLEKRFGVLEPNITPWRRAVCGDLTSVFDFSASDAAPVSLPDTAGYVAAADNAHLLPPVVWPLDAILPEQEPGQRPARPLPYALDAIGQRDGDAFAITLVNRGRVAACLSVHARNGGDGPWFYTVGAGETLTDRLPMAHYTVHGPNGFLRGFENTVAPLFVGTHYDPADASLVLTLQNSDSHVVNVSVASSRYGVAEHRLVIAPGAQSQDRWAIATADHWYDLEVRSGNSVWRLAGHVETGRASRSDPLIGRA